MMGKTCGSDSPKSCDPAEKSHHSDFGKFLEFIIDRSEVDDKNSRRRGFSVDDFFLDLEDAYGTNDLVE